MNIKRLLFIAATASSLTASAQTISPKAIYTDSTGVVNEVTSIDNGQAPLEVSFRANPSGLGAHTASYEWHFRRDLGNNKLEEMFSPSCHTREVRLSAAAREGSKSSQLSCRRNRPQSSLGFSRSASCWKASSSALITGVIWCSCARSSG